MTYQQAKLRIRRMLIIYFTISGLLFLALAVASVLGASEPVMIILFFALISEMLIGFIIMIDAVEHRNSLMEYDDIQAFLGRARG